MKPLGKFFYVHISLSFGNSVSWKCVNFLTKSKLFCYSVCNWPEQSAPCEEVTTVGEVESSGDGEATTEGSDSMEYEEGGDADEDAGEEEDSSNVIITPSFDYVCTEEGLFGHDSNCAKFWLCKGKVSSPSLMFHFFI